MLSVKTKCFLYSVKEFYPCASKMHLTFNYMCTCNRVKNVEIIIAPKQSTDIKIHMLSNDVIGKTISFELLYFVNLLIFKILCLKNEKFLVDNKFTGC